MRDILGMMKQAKELQGKMQQMQEEIGALTVEGSAGGGLVRVTLSGRSEARAVSIDPSLMKPEEAEILEDLLVAAINDARGKVEQKTAERVQALTGGLGLPPGLKF